MSDLYLYGTVGASFWDETHFTADTVREFLADASGPITARINSGGGIASEGLAIYSLLRDYPDQVDVVIDSIAASAASLIAMAGDTITMRLGATMMIHDPANPWAEGRGTEDDHLRAAKALRTTANAFAKVYGKRAGMSAEDARAIMREEIYYEGDQAVAAGFADAFDDDSEPAETAALFDYRVYPKAPAALLDVAKGITARKPASPQRPSWP